MEGVVAQNTLHRRGLLLGRLPALFFFGVFVAPAGAFHSFMVFAVALGPGVCLNARAVAFWTDYRLAVHTGSYSL